MKQTLRWAALWIAGVSASWAMAQPLSLDQALALAKERNGTILAARLNVAASRSSVAQARASFLPTVTPTFRYDTSRVEQYTGTAINRNSAGSSLDVTASWTLLDSGQRRFNLANREASLSAQEATALQTLRSQLFTVTQRFYEAQRSQELLRVQKAQLERAELVLKQTRARADVGDIARIEVLQAEADQLNAQVAVLEAESRVKATLANLKAIIGWEESSEPLSLAGTPEFVPVSIDAGLNALIQSALENRADLIASRRQLQAQRFSVRLAQADAGISLSVQTGYTRSFERDVFNRSSASLVASFPLFDGRRSREEVRQARLTAEAAEARLVQDERDVRGEVEEAFNTYSQNVLRLRAAQAALEAARKNFEAASRSQALGSGNLIQVVQAQTSLVTAEVNAVQAVFDALVSDVRLKLAIGSPLPGESESATR